MNDARIHDNWFFDNWRFGTMLFAVPDALTSARRPRGRRSIPGVSCAGAPDNEALDLVRQPTTSATAWARCRPGFDVPRAARRATACRTARPAAGRCPTASTSGGTSSSTNRWNCWFDNTGPDGTPGSVTGSGRRGRPPGAAAERAARLRRRREPRPQRRQRRRGQGGLPRRLLRRARTRTPARWTATGGRRRRGRAARPRGRARREVAAASRRFAARPRRERAAPADGCARRAGRRLARCAALSAVGGRSLFAGRAGAGCGGERATSPTHGRGQAGRQGERGLGRAVRRLRRLARGQPRASGWRRSSVCAAS